MNFDFGSVLGPFWEGFGRPKSVIFTFFRDFFKSKIEQKFWKAKTQEKLENVAQDAPCGGVCRPVGERIYRIGGAQHGQNFKFSL